MVKVISQQQQTKIVWREMYFNLYTKHITFTVLLSIQLIALTDKISIIF